MARPSFSQVPVIGYLGGLGLDELFMVNNGTNESYLRDALNSTIAMTDATGTIRDQVTGACPEGCRRNP